MALEPIDYTTHCHAIEDAFQKVVRASDDEIDWLILTPNGQKQYVPEKLGSGFSEFLGSFEESKVEYGLARVSPPGSDVQKLVLVGWCPDNAPLKTRASFASNFGVVANQVLKSYHIQVTARDEDDLDEKELLNKVSNAAGARYSIQNEIPTKTSSAPKPRPSSVPKKPETTTPKPAVSKEPVTVPKNEPTKTSAGDDDWDEPEVEERDLDANPLKPNKSSWNPVGKVDLQKLVAEENSKADPRLVNTVKAESPSKLNPKDDIEKLRQQSKAQRDAEMKKYLGTKPPSVVLPKKSDDMVVKGFQNEKSPAQLWAEKHQQKTDLSIEKASSEVEKPDQTSEKEENDEAAPEVSDIKSKFEKLNTAEPAIIKPGQVRSPPPSTDAKTSVPTGLSAGPKKLIGNPLPGMQKEIDSDSGEERADDDDDWDDDEDDDNKATATISAPPTQSRPAAPAPAPRPVVQSRVSGKESSPEPSPKPTEAMPPALPTRSSESTFVPPPPPRRNVPVTAEKEKEPEQPAEESEPEQPEEFEKPASTKQEKLPSAIAEYDNEAEEHNELAFSEGDKIVNIVFVDDEWWLGELETTGEKGLFPSNYVQLVD
ncbi:LAFA_0F12926g1_1 [Lachancea sp. 'fantastica']|nr:LAFA_0F12926g1_1 [Lachancea sp. 'fantastica']